MCDKVIANNKKNVAIHFKNKGEVLKAIKVLNNMVIEGGFKLN